MASYQLFQLFALLEPNNHPIGGQLRHGDLLSRPPIRHATTSPIRLLKSRPRPWSQNFHSDVLGAGRMTPGAPRQGLCGYWDADFCRAPLQLTEVIAHPAASPDAAGPRRGPRDRDRSAP